MSYQKAIAACLTVLFSVPAYSDVIETWGDGVPDVDYVWYPLSNDLVIYHGNGLNYKFWFHDGSEEPGTGVIDNITVDPNAVGDFSLLIAYPVDPNDPNSPVDPNEAGALDWNEGDLRYAGGTSTVTGVSVAGNLGEQGEWIHIDQLDGSIDVEGTTAILDIQEWVSASPAYIHLVGHATSINLGSDCAADIVADDGLTYLEVDGDLSGSVDIDGYGNMNIFGDVLDSGDNHVWIGTLGGFDCNNMQLSNDPDRWLTFGPQVGPISGNITINNTLSGVVQFYGRYESQMIVGTIDAGPQAHADMQYGGRVAHPSRSEGWGRDSFGWKGENSAVCGGRY